MWLKSVCGCANPKSRFTAFNVYDCHACEHANAKKKKADARKSIPEHLRLIDLDVRVCVARIWCLDEFQCTAVEWSDLCFNTNEKKIIQM